MLRAAGARNLHAEFWGITGPCPALTALRDMSGGTHIVPPGTERTAAAWRGARALEADVVMVLETDPGRGPVGEVEVRELTDPDEAFWVWYRGTRQEFGVEFTDPVVDQLVHRDQVISHPAGLRWFVGYVDRTMAGFTSLLSLERVGYLDNVLTLPAYRRRGVASATVRAALRASLGGGDRIVHLLAEEGSAPARLYDRLGFRVRHRVESFNRRLRPEPIDHTGPGERRRRRPDRSGRRPSGGSRPRAAPPGGRSIRTARARRSARPVGSPHPMRGLERPGPGQPPGLREPVDRASVRGQHHRRRGPPIRRRRPGDDPMAAWDGSATPAIAAVSGPGAMHRVVHLSFGDARDPSTPHSSSPTTSSTAGTWPGPSGGRDARSGPGDGVHRVVRPGGEGLPQERGHRPTAPGPAGGLTPDHPLGDVRSDGLSDRSPDR